MSRFVDRPVCVTGGAVCPGWTPLHVNVPRAEHVGSMRMFMEMIPLCDLLRQCMRLASNNCFSFESFCGWLHASSFRRKVSLSLSISAQPVLTEDLNHDRLLSFLLVGASFLRRLTFNFFLSPRVLGKVLSVVCHPHLESWARCFSRPTVVMPQASLYHCCFCY